MGTPAGPPTLKDPKQIYSVYSILEEFEKVEGKDDNEKLDLKWPGVMVWHIHKDEKLTEGPESSGSIPNWERKGTCTCMGKMTCGVKGENNFLGLLDMGSQCSMIPKPIGEVLMESTVKWEDMGMQRLMGLRWRLD